MTPEEVTEALTYDRVHVFIMGEDRSDCFNDVRCEVVDNAVFILDGGCIHVYPLCNVRELRMITDQEGE